MRRQVVLSVLLIVGLLSIAVTASQRGGGAGLNATPSVDALEVEKLADNLFVLRGGGGNTAAFVSSKGVVLVDTKLSGWGQPLLAKLKTLTDRPITTIINTHAHFDHVNGNTELPSVEIVTHQNTKMFMEQWNPVHGFAGDIGPSPFKASGGKGLPTRTFADRLTLGAGNDRVELFHYGRAHTGGDAYVVFPAARVMHAGDTFPNKTTPIMDRNNGGSGLAYADTLAKAAATPNVERVITGHSAVMSVGELREYSEFIRDLVRSVQEAKKAGRTIDEVVNTWKVPARFKGYNQPQPASLRANVEVIWDETK